MLLNSRSHTWDWPWKNAPALTFSLTQAWCPLLRCPFHSLHLSLGAALPSFVVPNPGGATGEETQPEDRILFSFVDESQDFEHRNIPRNHFFLCQTNLTSDKFIRGFYVLISHWILSLRNHVDGRAAACTRVWEGAGGCAGPGSPTDALASQRRGACDGGRGTSLAAFPHATTAGFASS